MASKNENETQATALITDAQLTALRDESAAAGDLAQVAICERALDELSRTTRDEDPLGADARIADRAAVDAALAMTIEAARAECARVIADALAQED